MTDPAALVDVRLRTVIDPAELAEKVGKIVTEQDFNLLVTGPARLRRPDGSLLAIYLPGVLADTDPRIVDVLSGLKRLTTNNRGLASGTPRVKRSGSSRTSSKAVASAVIGAVDPMGQQRYCRLTAWTGKEFDTYREVWPLLQDIAGHFAQHVPDRFAAQMAYVDASQPDWIIPGTPFSTVTVNNTYPTGVHQDAGDLDVGFSTLACFRRGQYTGGVLTFPEYRVAVDMRHGDLLLMNAHAWHGNTLITPASPDAERISVVSYFRTKVRECASPADEAKKAAAYAARTSLARANPEA